MAMTDLLDDNNIIKAVNNAARRVAKTNSAYVTVEDLVQDSYLWLLDRPDKVDRAKEAGQYGFLAFDLTNYLRSVAIKARVAIEGTEVDDYFMYRAAVVEMLLPEVLDGEPDGSTTEDLNSTIRGKRPINEGHDKQAMLADVAQAFAVMDEDDKHLLSMRYADGGMTEEAIGIALGLTQQAASKRLKRAVNRMADALNGELPVFRQRKRDHQKREVWSNARAQVETRRQEGGE